MGWWRLVTRGPGAALDREREFEAELDHCVDACAGVQAGANVEMVMAIVSTRAKEASIPS
jgi:hypothetical protein